MLKALAVAAALLVSTAVASDAQVMKGRVVHAATKAPLPDVLVTLIGADTRRLTTTTTGPDGEFRLHAPRLGTFTVSAERIGMATTTTTQLRLGVSEEVEVELRMAETPLTLEPLTVNGRAYMDLGPLAGYYQRVEHGEKLGFGHFITRDQIAERGAVDVVDLLRDIPRVQIIDGGRTRARSVMFRGGIGECTPKVFINGIYQNRGGAMGSAAVLDESVRPFELEGIEVYRGLSETPAEYYDENHCGAILLWTRRDGDGGRPFSWRRILIAASAVLVLGYVLAR